MPWSLEIHHIGLNNSGDATLIIAKDTPIPTLANPDPVPITVRSALIDGGRFNHSPTVHEYLTNTAQIQQLDVMVATHYDADHFNGLRALLSSISDVYNNTFIFDQGEPGDIPQFNGGPYDYRANYRPANRQNPYSLYLESIYSRGQRKRVTAFVDSNNTAGGNANWQPPNWLIGKEIFWIGANRYDDHGNYDPNGNYNAAREKITPAQRNLGSWNIHGNPIDINQNVLIPPGAPTIRCIAANQYRQGNAALVGGAGADTESRKNKKSLIFLVQFNNFKYFIGGDAEQDQENALDAILNPTNDFAGRVHALKLSHHGAATSSSPAFITRLKPCAVFISNGPSNQFGHPHQEVINAIEAISVNSGTANGLLNYYLTGESNLGANLNRPAAAVLQANIAEVPGYPDGPVGGKHLKITVSHQQSNNSATSNNNFTVHWQDAGPVAQSRVH